ncbi:MAG: hypothetical protein DRP66_11895 [Planctomycetota bacterium]|nr:MAG: hypothetical protein DRP66_11895 [Planctomycetota bacterium]
MIAAEVFFAYHGFGKRVIRFIWKGRIMHRSIWIVLVLYLLAGLPATILQAQTATDAQTPSRWAKDIRAFEAWDAKNSFPADAVLFVGSSSIRMWPTQKSFPNLPVINRGFGGSQISDANQFAKRIVLKYAPRLIVFYAGENDIAAGKSPEQVLKDYRAFVKIVHDALPRTPIIYMAIKPSRSLRPLWPKMDKVNSLIRQFCVNDTRRFFVDGAGPLLGEDGEPDYKFYLDDKLHLNADGYNIWTKLLDPIRLIGELNLEETSLALLLIKKGMGPHTVSQERLDKVTSPKKAEPGTVRKTGNSETPGANDLFWVASKSSKVFHKSTCRFAARISEKNKVTFANRDKAAQTGRRPCKTCNP